MTRAIFPGTFDPFTAGHASIVRRALTFIDEIVIAIGINESKHTHFPLEQRKRMIADYYRGIRTVRDFEYEETIADINRKLTGIETILLFTEPELTCVSSTIVRELLSFGKDISQFVPEGMRLNQE